jgi:hypothetical protein
MSVDTPILKSCRKVRNVNLLSLIEKTRRCCFSVFINSCYLQVDNDNV